MKNKEVAIAIRQIKRRTGAVRNVVEQAQYFKKLGYNVTILAEQKSDDILREAGAQFVRMSRWPIKGLYRRLWFLRSVERWRKKHAVDLFVSHGDCATNGLLVMHNCVRLHQELCGGELAEVAEVHDRIISSNNYKTLIANSVLMKRDLQQRYGIDGDKIHVFYQGVDSQQFNCKDHKIKRAKGRELLGIDQDSKLIGLVTSGDLEKRDAEFFIRFAQTLRERCPENVRFVVMGNSKPERLERLASELGMSDHISFHDPVERVDYIFHALDLHVLPAKLEEYGRVVLEGLACGIPSLVSDTVGAGELMTKHGVPHVLSKSDPEAWVEHACSLLCNEEVHRDLARASEVLGQKYSMLLQLKQMEKILTELIQ